MHRRNSADVTALLREAFRRLPSSQRRVVTAHVKDEQPLWAYGVVVGKKESAVRQMQFRSVHQMRATLFSAMLGDDDRVIAFLHAYYRQDREPGDAAVDAEVVLHEARTRAALVAGISAADAVRHHAQVMAALGRAARQFSLHRRDARWRVVIAYADGCRPAADPEPVHAEFALMRRLLHDISKYRRLAPSR